jgi:hypothetical protein
MVTETSRKTTRAIRSSGFVTTNKWIGGVKKKFNARNERIEAAKPERSPPMAAAAVTARTYARAAVAVETWIGSVARSVAAPGSATPTTNARTVRILKCFGAPVRM